MRGGGYKAAWISSLQLRFQCFQLNVDGNLLINHLLYHVSGGWTLGHTWAAVALDGAPSNVEPPQHWQQLQGELCALHIVGDDGSDVPLLARAKGKGDAGERVEGCAAGNSSASLYPVLLWLVMEVP